MARIITIEHALSMIQSGDHIVAGMAAAEGQLFFSKLHTLHGVKTNISIDNCLPMNPYPFLMEATYKDTFTINSWFFSSDLRKAFPNGNVHFIPNHLHFAGVRRLDHQRPDWYVGVATPPDENGMVSLSLSNVYENRMIQAAEKVILEINPNFPRTLGDMLLPVDQVDYLIEVDYPVPELPDTEPNERDRLIGQHIAPMIQDGDTLQLGIGGIPNAIVAMLIDKKDLGVHTEMLTSGFVSLYQAGAITNQKKNRHPGKFVACFALGNRALYDFIHNNPDVQLMDGHYVNDPSVIGQNDNQVSINTTIEIDLTGQCCSESIGHRQFSGTGGQSDTATGSQRSKNGRSFIALYSTTMATNKATGQKEEISKIVPTLKPGAAVSLSRNDVMYVVTEYGMVNLRGTSIKERAELLTSIAHPKFRESLREEAKQLGYL